VPHWVRTADSLSDLDAITGRRARSAASRLHFFFNDALRWYAGNSRRQAKVRDTVKLRVTRTVTSAINRCAPRGDAPRAARRIALGKRAIII